MNFQLTHRALAGGNEATKMYCGSYTLVARGRKFYRCKGDIPYGFVKIEGAYDRDGFLLPKYWALPRI